MDDDVIDGDVFNREARLRELGIAAVIYSSHSYGFGKMGGRVCVCLNRSYRPDEHKVIWHAISHLLGGGFDKAGRSPGYGMHARRSHDAPHNRVVLDGVALNADALVALGRQMMPARTTTVTEHQNVQGHSAAIEEIRSAAEFCSGYLDEHPELFADENDWMDLARSFAHQAWRCPEQREELEQLLDGLSQKAPKYDKENNAEKFERYIAEASARPTTGDVGGARTISSFLAQMRDLGWKGYVPTGVAWDVPGYEMANR
jgi:hypothetical protein